MKSKLEILDKQHWQYEDYRQRIVTKDWRDILLNFDDHVIFKGRVRKLLSENKGAGVIEVWK